MDPNDLPLKLRELALGLHREGIEATAHQLTEEWTANLAPSASSAHIAAVISGYKEKLARSILNLRDQHRQVVADEARWRRHQTRSTVGNEIRRGNVDDSSMGDDDGDQLDPRTMELDQTLELLMSMTLTPNQLGESGERSRQQAGEQDTVPCMICTEDIPFTDVFQGSCENRCSYCRECLRNHYTISFKEEWMFPLKCCVQRIPIDKATPFLTEEMLQTYCEKVIEYGTPHDKRIYCHDPTCSRFIPASVPGRNDVRVCPRCRKRTCAFCKQAEHPEKETCPQDESSTRFRELAQNRGWKKCPGCGRMIELGTGCNHMTCKCGAQFCYGCGEPWGVPRTCRCPLFYEAHPFAQQNRIDADMFRVAAGQYFDAPGGRDMRTAVFARANYYVANRTRGGRVSFPPVPAQATGEEQGLRHAEELVVKMPEPHVRPLGETELQDQRREVGALEHAERRILARFLRETAGERRRDVLAPPTLPITRTEHTEFLWEMPEPYLNLGPERPQRGTVTGTRLAGDEMRSLTAQPAQQYRQGYVDQRQYSEAEILLRSQYAIPIEESLPRECWQPPAGTERDFDRGHGQDHAAIPPPTWAPAEQDENPEDADLQHQLQLTPAHDQASRAHNTHSGPAMNQAVEEPQNRLQNDDCLHLVRWRRRDGPGRCHACGCHKNRYLLECPHCKQLSCEWCRRELSGLGGLGFGRCAFGEHESEGTWG